MRCAKMAQWIEALFRVEALGDQRNTVLDGDPDPPMGSGEEGEWGKFCPQCCETTGDSMQLSPYYFGHLLHVLP